MNKWLPQTASSETAEYTLFPTVRVHSLRKVYQVIIEAYTYLKY